MPSILTRSASSMLDVFCPAEPLVVTARDARRPPAAASGTIGLVATTMEPPSVAERAARRERADAVERDGMQTLVDYMHAGVRPGLP
ncbi:MAG TPA: hypothetical protein VMA73_07310 [Streptosporangiaceae bacterium]|nr:hypothetical protein [Streptosporangiaceae bacterium]